MQRYQTEDERRKAMRAKINKTIKRGRRRKRIIRRLRKAVPGICIGVLIAGMGAWCIAAPLPDPDDYEPYRFQAENGQWYTQEEYEQMSRERDAYHQREREEAEKEAQMIRDYQEQYQKLSKIVRLPPAIESYRQRLDETQRAVDKMRVEKEPEALVKYPVQGSLYEHQVRAANMALLTFGLADPKEVLKSE